MPNVAVEAVASDESINPIVAVLKINHSVSTSLVSRIDRVDVNCQVLFVVLDLESAVVVAVKRMDWVIRLTLVVFFGACQLSFVGCKGTRSRQDDFSLNESSQTQSYRSVYPVQQSSLQQSLELIPPAEEVGNYADYFEESQVSSDTKALYSSDASQQLVSVPRSIRDGKLPTERWRIALDKVIEIAFSNGEVIRSLGGQVIANPAAAISILDPRIQQSNPFFGEMAAVSQFDPTFQMNATAQKNDDVFNNILLGGGANEVQQDLFNWNYTLSKFAKNGMQFTLSGLDQHDSNNASQNLFDHSWTQALEASIRTPLLQGAGTEFNQIAGPNSTIGLRASNGILLAQINTEISALQFERNVREFLSELVAAYWQLYFAYENFDAASVAYEKAKLTWEFTAERKRQELVGGEADREAIARGQMIRFETQKLAALSGSGVGDSGIYEAEANLRRLMGIDEAEINPNLMEPADAPLEAELNYDWSLLLDSALSNRRELREQGLRVQQREFELLAAKNFTLPRLDATVLWRNNGFGDDRTGNGRIPGTADQRFSSSQKDFWSMNHQEWEFNVQFAVPLGRRLEFEVLRNAELHLRKERAILDEQQKSIRHLLAQAFRNLELSYHQKLQAEKQLTAANGALEAREELYRIDKISLDELITAQQNYADAKVNLARSLTSYETARLQIQVERGTLLADYGVTTPGVGAR